MAQYGVLMYAHGSAHAPGARPADTHSRGGHSGELAGSGAQLAAYALTPRGMATSIRGGSITGGPFIDSRDVVAGIYVIEAPGPGAAVAIARLNPVVRDGGGVEVRPVHGSYVIPGHTSYAAARDLGQAPAWPGSGSPRSRPGARDGPEPVRSCGNGRSAAAWHRCRAPPSWRTAPGRRPGAPDDRARLCTPISVGRAVSHAEMTG